MLSLTEKLNFSVIFLTLFCCRKEEKKLDESKMQSPITEIDLQFYSENELEQEKNLTENIENAFATITDNAEKIHNYYICSNWKCICTIFPLISIHGAY